MTAPTPRNVTADLFQVIGTALVGARVVYTLNHSMTFSTNGGGVVPAGSTSAISDVNGIAVAALIPNAVGDYASQYGVEIYDAAGNKVFPAKGVARMYLQDQDALLHAILYSVPPMSQSDADRAVTEARNWATYIGGDVPSTPGARSARSWAQDDLRGITYGGSAKDWASGTGLIDQVFYSSRKYAVDAAASAQASEASRQVADGDKAQTGLDRVQTGLDRTQTGIDVLNANNSSLLAAGSALTAIAQAGLASVMALAAASVVSQDISGVTAQALHRSPNPVVSQAVYNAANDADGGAWIGKVDASYLYETLNGAYTQHPNINGIQSEIVARALGGTINSTNLMAGANNTTAGWVAGNSGTLSLGTNNRLRVTNSAVSPGFANWTVALTAGQTYVLYADLLIGSSTSAPYVRVSNDAGATWNVLTITSTGSGVFVAPTTGNYLVQFGNGNANLGYYFEVGGVHLHQVTAWAPSGSYYPNATDGKFNRLWRNLLSQSGASGLSDVNSWTRLNIASVGVDGKVTPSAGAAVTKLLQALKVAPPGGANAPLPAGLTATFMFKAKAAELSKVWVGFGNNGNSNAGGMVLDVGTGAVVANTNVGGGVLALTSTSVDPVDGYRIFVITMNGGAAATFSQVAFGPTTLVAGSPSQPDLQLNQNNTFNGTDGLFLKDAHLEYGVVAAPVLESKGTDGTQTETFRGNTARFPRQAAIVAEASRLVIYDLLSPGRPMWMVFVKNSISTWDTSNIFALFSGSTFTSVAMLNGELYTGDSGQGVQSVNFARDSGNVRGGSSGTGGAYRGNIAQRNSGKGHDRSNTQFIASPVVNALSMTAMPDAPLDPVTGLPVPTIAVTTNSGASIIQNNGTVVSDTGGVPFSGVTINPYVIAVDRGASAFYYALAPGKLANGWTLTLLNQNQAPDFVRGLSQLGVATNKVGGRGTIARSDSLGGLHLLRLNESNLSASLAAYIASGFNTGWMVGDIRRCMFSSISTGAVTGVDLTSNNDFAVDAVWNKNYPGGGASPWTIAGGVASITGNGTIAQLSAETLQVGDVVRVTFTITAFGTGNVYPWIAGTHLQIGTGQPKTGLGTYTVDVPVNTVVDQSVGFLTGNSPVGISIDNVSFKKIVVADRSYKAGVAVISGAPTKAQVASAAQLTFWGNWSAANYAQEAYSADYDVGTGGFAALPWISLPANPQLYQNLVPKSNLFGAGSSWTQDGLTVADADAVVNGITYAKLQQPAASTLNNRVFLGSATTPTVINVNFSFYVHRVAASTDKLSFTPTGAWNSNSAEMVYDPVTQTMSGNANGWTVTIIDANTARLSCVNAKAAGGGSAYWSVAVRRASDNALFGGGTGGVHVAQYQMTVGPALLPYEDVPAAVTVRCHPVMDRSAAGGGASTQYGIGGDGFLMARVNDGTTSRTAAATVSHLNAGALLAEFSLSSSGALTLKVSGEQVAQATGAPLLTLNNATAVTTWGNARTLDAPFPGSFALARFGATVPTDDQSRFIWQQERAMFRDAAQVTLPDAGLCADLDYDPALDRWHVTSAANESSFVGLVRVFTAATAAGSNSKISAKNGTKLVARITTNPGVDVTIPSQNLREELAKAGAEQAAARARGEEMYDYAGGFTATITTGSAVLSAVAGLSLPTQGGVNLQGASVSGVGIPGGTTIAYHSGTTIYLSAPCTSGAAGTQINLLDFPLPTGMEARSVFAGTSGASLKQEGISKDYTRLFDGFREKPRFGAAPGNTAFVRVNARRMAA